MANHRILWKLQNQSGPGYYYHLIIVEKLI